MSTQCLRFLLPLLLMPLSAEAAEIAKQGTDSYTTTYVVTSSHAMKLGDRTYTTLEFGGIARNDKGSGMFHNMGVRCLGTRDAVGNEVTTRGTCIEMDKDGDQVFTTYEAKGSPSTGVPVAGAHVFVGGTGKYIGISGKADYSVEPVKAPDNMPMFIVPHKATWKLQ